MFIIQEQPVHHDVLIASDEIDMDQFVAPTQFEECILNDNKLTSTSSSTSSSDNDVSTDDNESSVVGSPIVKSYTIQETSMSEVEVSFIAPTYSPIRLSDDDCTSPQQTEEVHFTVEISAEQQMATDSISQNFPVDDTTTSTLSVGDQTQWSGFKIVMDNIDKNFRPSYQRVDHQTKSLQCVHMFASKD